MELSVYNTLSGKKEVFCPLDGKNVVMYVCGVTVYDDCHLGHARAYVAFDMIYRYLRHLGYNVVYIRNVTDIDDKIINRVHEIYGKNIEPDRMKKLCAELSDKYYKSFEEDMGKLNLAKPTIEPKATAHIGDIIKIVKNLIEKGFAYERDGNVYYRVEKFKDYGKLSKRKLSDMRAGARVEADENKENPFDFALWKRAKEGEPYWESPWGKGRPGWHIECSAMSLKYCPLQTLDIHGGGQDLIFPHHENEIAQSEAYTGQPFAKYWIHNGFITVNKEKMSKSLKNFKTLKELFAKYPPKAIKFFLLSTHYRSPIDFSDSLIRSSLEGLRKIENALMISERFLSGEYKKCDLANVDEFCLKYFENAMNDDFNSAKAIGVVFETVSKLTNAVHSKKSCEVISKLRNTVVKMLKILGVSFEIARIEAVYYSQNENYSIIDEKSLLMRDELSDEDIKKLVSKRLFYKKNKEYEKADYIRSELMKKGIELRDTLNGTEWKRK